MASRPAFELRTPRSAGPLLLLMIVLLPGVAWSAPQKNPDPPRPAAAPKTSTGQSNPVLDQAKRLIDGQQPEEAATILRKFLTASPTLDHLEDAYLLMAAALYGMKEFGEATKYAQQLIGEFPESELLDRAKLLLAKTLAAQGNVDLAIPLLSEVRSLSPDDNVKREALRLTGEYQVRRGDILRAVQAWLDEMKLEPDDQPKEAEGRIRDLVHTQSDRPVLIRIRDAYPRTFPGDLALIRLIDLHQAGGEDHLIERNIKLFLARFPSHPYVTRALELQAFVRERIKAHPFRLAAVFPLTGKLAPYGTDVLNGIQLALERTKEAADGPSMGLIVKDTEADRGSFLDDLSEMLSEDRPIAVIGPLLSKNLPAMAELADRARIPLITPTAVMPNLRRLGSFVFSTSLTYGHQAKRIAAYAVQEQHHRRFAILHPETAYGRELARLFAQEVQQLGAEVVAVDSYREGDTDFRAAISRLKTEDLKRYGVEVPVETQAGKSSRSAAKKTKRMLYSPGFDAVFLPGRSIDVGLLVAQLTFHDIIVPVLGTNGLNTPDLARIADRSLEGSVFVDGFFVDSANPMVQDFVERYRRRYRAEPTLFAAQGYDAARLVWDALRRGATSGESVRDYLLLHHDLPTLGGPTGFSPEGTLNRRLFLIQVRQGKLVQLESPP